MKKAKYRVVSTKLFRKQFRKVVKQGKSRVKIEKIIDYLTDDTPLPKRFPLELIRIGSHSELF